MTDEEARALCAAAQGGDVESGKRIAEAHLRLAHLIAFDWVRVYGGAAKNFHISTKDLEQMALVILIEEVIPHYHVDGPVPFRSFARRKMNAGLWRALKYQIRQHELIVRATPYLREHYIEHAAAPDPEESYAQGQVIDTANRVIADGYFDGRLTLDQVNVMRLVVKGYSGRVIAQEIGIPAKRVYVLISGARAALRGDFYAD